MGAVMATMNQSTEAQESGTGGWLDAVTYMAGLSGGSRATGTFIAKGAQLPSDMIDNVSLSLTSTQLRMTDGQLWNLESNLIFPDDGKLSFYSDLLSQVNSKGDEGFATQLVSLIGIVMDRADDRPITGD
jgi:lysophospholipase